MTPACGTVSVTVAGDMPLERGQMLEINGHISRPGPPANPGEFDYRAYLASSRILRIYRQRKQRSRRVIDAMPSSGWNGLD